MRKAASRPRAEFADPWRMPLQRSVGSGRRILSSGNCDPHACGAESGVSIETLFFLRGKSAENDRDIVGRARHLNHGQRSRIPAGSARFTFSISPAVTWQARTLKTACVIVLECALTSNKKASVTCARNSS